MNVLIVEDEKSLAKELEIFLKKSFYTCDIAYNGNDASEKIAVNLYDFILIDLGLPDYDGLDLLTEAKKNNPEAAYLILTARSGVNDRIKGLDLGADDYLAKPFSLLELQSRMAAIARRKFGVKNTSIPVGEFQVDLTNRTVMHNGKEITAITKKEFDLISYLVLHKNRTLNRLQLNEHIWGNLYDDDYESNFIDAHIKNIRKKLNLFATTEWLETVRGVGYRIKLID